MAIQNTKARNIEVEESVEAKAIECNFFFFSFFLTWAAYFFFPSFSDIPDKQQDGTT
jgi:hypothetical protein